MQIWQIYGSKKSWEKAAAGSLHVEEDLSLDGDVGPTALHWKKSIKKYTIECLVCGAAFKQLSVRHLKEHGLDARSYRVRFGIPRTQPLSANTHDDA